MPDRVVLLLVRRDGDFHVVWVGLDGLQTERLDAWLSSDCRLTGGQWQNDAFSAPAILVPGPRLRKFDDAFAPLLQFVKRGEGRGARGEGGG